MPTRDPRLLEASVLVALGDLAEAERGVEVVLEDDPDDLTALNLFAKIKHMKGELSQAIACWAQLHARSPHNELVLMRLASLLQLARDPERHAGDFVALGYSQPGRSPAVLFELTEAFRQMLARRTDEAKATCDRLATRQRGKDRDLYKLCVMAKAWIAELSGDLGLARGTLEDLGKERGFETDMDRVLALARIYEQGGDAAQLEKAVHVHRFFQRSFERITAESHLAGLYRKLGRPAEAAEHERRFLFAFERRMHRPSWADVARVAGQKYLPLERLATVTPSSDTTHDLREPRERAIFDWLVGDVIQARQWFEGAREVIDQKYLGDARAHAGEIDGAIDAYLEALREDPNDAYVASFVLTRWAGQGDARVERALGGTALGERVREGLEAALQRSPRQARLWLSMGAVLQLEGREEDAARYRERAQAVEEASARDGRPVGRVLAAAVYRFVGKGKGLVHQVWADRKPTAPRRGGFLHAEDILGNVTPDMQKGVRNTFFAVREFARSRFPHRTADILDYDYTYKVTKEDEPSGGLSAELPTALAFLSVFLQEPIPQDLAFSGVVIADAHDVLVVRGVGDAEYKVKAAYHRNLRAVVLPLENRSQLQQNELVPRTVCDELVRHVSSFDEAITLALGTRVWID